MFKIFDYPGDAPDLPTLSRLCHSLAEMSLQNHRTNIATVKILQALVQDIAARDPEIVDRLRRVFEISAIDPEIMPSISLILRGITRPDDPAAIHESDLPAKH
jgi:hypothetical protein